MLYLFFFYSPRLKFEVQTEISDKCNSPLFLPYGSVYCSNFKIWCFNYLGVTEDESLSWNSHISYVTSLVYPNLKLLNRISSFLGPTGPTCAWSAVWCENNGEGGGGRTPRAPPLDPPLQLLFLKIYRTTILSNLDNRLYLWGFCSRKNPDVLERFQNKSYPKGKPPD